MSKLRLEDLKAALAQRRPPAAKSEADHKRELVAAINALPGGRARRIEDRYGTGILDLIIKLPDRPLILAEAKLINGNLFAPTGAQYEEGKKWQAAGVKCLLMGWKQGQIYISQWVEKADLRDCFSQLIFPMFRLCWSTCCERAVAMTLIKVKKVEARGRRRRWRHLLAHSRNPFDSPSGQA